jgi:hypothetical protein
MTNFKTQIHPMKGFYFFFIGILFLSCNYQTKASRYSQEQFPPIDLKQKRLDYINSSFAKLTAKQREFRLWEDSIQPDIEKIFTNFSTDSNTINKWLQYHISFDKEQQDSLTNLINGLKRMDAKLSSEFYKEWNLWLKSRKEWLQTDRQSLFLIKRFVLDVCKYNNDINRVGEISFKSESTRQYFIKNGTDIGKEMEMTGTLTEVNKQLAISSGMAAMLQLIKDNE